MAEENYAALYAQAIAESGSGSEILPDGKYNVKIGTVKPDKTKAGKFKVGIRLQVLDGPLAGKSTWINQSFSPESPKAISIFIRLMQELGVPADAVKAGLPPETLIQYIVAGSTGVADIGSHINGVNQDATPKKWQDLKGFRLVQGLDAGNPVSSGVSSASAVPVQAPVASEPQPAQPAPVAAPPLPVQPGAPAPGAAPAPF